jgi:16S rRNA (adenine1518-N6/adenine1519-N6)-dimethyltransferase
MNITEIMSTLSDLGVSPRKSLGQNFLHDKNIAVWMVGKLDAKPGDHVIEIGPGLGALTEELLRRELSTTLLEKDRAFARYLRGKFGQNSGLEVIEGDALDYDTRSDFLRRPGSSEICRTICRRPFYFISAETHAPTNECCLRFRRKWLTG